MFEFYYVIVVYLFEKVDLSIHSLRISLVLESKEYFLYSEDGFCLFASNLPYVSVCSTSNLLDYLEALLYLTFDEVVLASSLLFLLMLFFVSHLSKNQIEIII